MTTCSWLLHFIRRKNSRLSFLFLHFHVNRKSIVERGELKVVSSLCFLFRTWFARRKSFAGKGGGGEGEGHGGLNWESAYSRNKLLCWVGVYFTVNYCDEGWGRRNGRRFSFLLRWLRPPTPTGVIKFMYVKTCCESENGKKRKTFACFIYWRSLAPHAECSDYGAEGKRPKESLANYDANYAY